MWQQLRIAVGWMPLAVGAVLFIGGIGELELVAHCTPEPQKLNLQGLLDGEAGENRHVEITDFQPCERYVVRSRKGGGQYIVYLGVQPAPREGEAEFPAAPRLLISRPQCSPNPESIAAWSQRQAIRGILVQPSKQDELQLRETYPGIDAPSCRILLEGRTPQPARESGTLVAIGFFGMALGGWMVYPGLISLVWNRLRGGKNVPAIGHPASAAACVSVAAVPPSGGGESGPTPSALAERILAIVFVLSLALQPLGFFLLAGVGSFLWLNRGLDGTVLGFGLGAIGWATSWGAFRWWARRWGRRRHGE